MYAIANPLINRAGDVASGDGMRFVVPVRSVHSSPNPKYLNRGRGITWYNLLSNAPASIPCPTEPPNSPNLRVSRSILRAAYSCTPVCQLAASSTPSFHAKYAPRIPNSLGPVM